MTVNLVDLPPDNPKPLNGKQFSQGTLWEGSALKPPEEHRYQQGYTPERKAQAQAALAGSTITVEPKFGSLYYDKSVKMPPLADNPTLARMRGGEPVRRSRAKQARSDYARSRMVESLARSTSPIEDLGDVPHISVATRYRSGGWYSHPGREGISRGQINITPSSRSGVEHSLMHELGHHVDYLADPATFRSRTFRNPNPALEGAAEGYAAKHQVQDPRSPTKLYKDIAAYKYLQKNDIFAGRFADVSGMTPPEAMARGVPEPPVHLSRQFDAPHLFGRNADIADTTVQRDYGQWGYSNYSSGESTDLGTLRVGSGAPAEPQYVTGFRPGDEQVVKDLRMGGSWKHEKGTRMRVAKRWNELHPEEPVKT